MVVTMSKVVIPMINFVHRKNIVEDKERSAKRKQGRGPRHADECLLLCQRRGPQVFFLIGFFFPGD